MKTRGYVRLALFVLLALLIALAQWNAITAIQEVLPAEYDAADLRITAEWRFGISESTGWYLKTRNVKGLPSVDRLNEHPETKRRIEDGQRARFIHGLFELGFYLAMLGYVFFGVRWLRGRFEGRSRGGRIAFETLAWIIGTSLTFLPLLIFGYGSDSTGSAVTGPMEGRGVLGFYPNAATYLVALLGFALPPLAARITLLVLVNAYVVPIPPFEETVRPPDDITIWIVSLLCYGFIGFLIGVARSVRHSPASEDSGEQPNVSPAQAGSS